VDVSVKASWHRAVVVEIDDSDPFADTPPLPSRSRAAAPVPVDVREVGRPIDLSGEQADLSRRLIDTVNAQQEAIDAGAQDCDLRWEVSVSCHACPLFSPDNRLCVLAREQEVIETQMTVNGHGGRRQQGA
jgi:hypothetical protein